MHAQTHCHTVTTVTDSYLRQWLAPDASEDGVRIPPKEWDFFFFILTKSGSELDMTLREIIIGRLGKKKKKKGSSLI